MIFSFWRLFSLVWVRSAIQTLSEESALRGAGVPVDLATVDRNEILSALLYETDPAKRSVLQSYL